MHNLQRGFLYTNVTFYELSVMLQGGCEVIQERIPFHLVKETSSIAMFCFVGSVSL